MANVSVRAFTPDEADRAKLYLATQVTTMMGRKLEEGDWTAVYCRAKNLPDAGWSNLHIDVAHEGFGLEMKLLRVPSLNGRPIRSVCGTSLMHPAATRSIRIDDTKSRADVVMRDVFRQYRDLIDARTERVRRTAPGRKPDMRIGWLLWEDNLTEFLYFEERMEAPDPAEYWAEWNDTGARGARKSSRSLWIYEKGTNKKRYSVTTSAGIKIQPYFDVPTSKSPNLFYFRTQGEPGPDASTILVWVASSTAAALQSKLGSLSKNTFTRAVRSALERATEADDVATAAHEVAKAIPIEAAVYREWLLAWEARSDEHRAQLLLKTL